MNNILIRKNPIAVFDQEVMSPQDEIAKTIISLSRSIEKLIYSSWLEMSTDELIAIVTDEQMMMDTRIHFLLKSLYEQHLNSQNKGENNV